MRKSYNSPTNFIDPSGKGILVAAALIVIPVIVITPILIWAFNKANEPLKPIDPNKSNPSIFPITPIAPISPLKPYFPSPISPINPNSPPSPSPSYSAGDVHLKTLDGIAYDFQGAGEYTLVKSTTDDFEIQTRQEPWNGSNSVTINTAAVIQLGGQKIGFYLDDPNPVRINGVAVNIPDGALYGIGQTLIARSGVAYNIFSANGDTIELTLTNCISLSISLADNRKGNVVGLLGDYNNSLNNEFALRDGTVIGATLTQQDLYGRYSNSWRIAQSDSLFDYAVGQTTDTFTNLNFPIGFVNITPQALAAATQIAKNAGITDPILLQNAIYDLAISNNDTAFLQGYTVQQQTINRNNPNVITSVNGYGSQRWVAGNAPLPYTIDFSNNATRGTTPIAQVTISEELDSDLDLNTFSLNSFTFGNVYVTVPPGSQNFSKRLDLQDTQGVFVDVQAGLDKATGTVTWSLTAIDPITGNSVDSATKGFLPPNDANDAGSGSVGYSIQPKANSANSTRIDARATITFNNLTLFQTNSVANLLDTDIPTSKVTAPPTIDTPSFNVSWAGTDNGSGIAAYDVYVATDGGKYTLWQSKTGATTTTYTGEIGKTYSFYSIATDSVGNTESKIPTAETTTKIVTPTPPPVNPIYGTATADNLVGTDANDIIYGDAGNDIIYGSAGNDIIYGGAGVDLLFGGAGKDIFGFNKPTEGIDKINDFKVGDDRLGISRSGFGGDAVFGSDSVVGAGLDLARFTLGSSATTSSQRFIYNDRSGALFFDVDGVGGAAQVRIGQLVGNPALTNASFAVL